MFLDFFAYIKIPMTILHVLSVVFGMGAALMSDMLFNFYSKDKKLSFGEVKTLSLISNAVWFALIIIILSGGGLFLSNIPKYIVSVKFLAKMSIMLVLLINGFILHKYIWKQVIKEHFLTDPTKTRARQKAFMGGAISVISWISVCSLGVIDSIPYTYWQVMLAYFGIIIFGIITAITIEKATFEK